MNNFQIPNQLMGMLKGGNPQQILSGLIQQRGGNNPMLQNVMSMMNGGDSKGIETMVRNICSSRGLDADEMLKQVQEQFK